MFIRFSTPSLNNFLIAILASVTCIVSIQKIFYGVDLLDESFLLSGGLRLALGDRPFIDDSTLAQGTSMVLYPLLKTFLWIQQGSDSLVLFCRFCYLALLLLFLFFFSKTFKKSYLLTLVLGSSFLLFQPLDIPNFHYNSLGILITYTTFLLVIIVEKKLAIQMIGLGFLQALTVLIHPGLSPFILVNYFWKYRFRKLGHYFLGILILFVTIGIFFRITPFDIFQSILHTLKQPSRHHDYLGWIRIQELFFSPAAVQIFLILSVPLGLGLLVNRYSQRFSQSQKIFYWFLISLLAAFCSRKSIGGFGVSEFWIIYTTFGLGWVYSKKESLSKIYQQWYRWAFLLGVSLSWFSTNRHLLLGYALAPLVILFHFILLEEFLKISDPPFLNGKLKWAVSVLAFSLFLVILFQRTSYSDGNYRLLTQRVSEGPYHYLMTSPEKQQYLKTIQNELASKLSKRQLLEWFPFGPFVPLLGPFRSVRKNYWDTILISEPKAQLLEHSFVILFKELPKLSGGFVSIEESVINEATHHFTEKGCDTVSNSSFFILFRCL